jgi:hypothetical protein
MELIKQTSLIEQANLHATRNYRLLFGMIALYFVTMVPLTYLYVGEVRSRQSNEIEIIYVNPAGDFVRIEQGSINHIQAIRYIIKRYIAHAKDSNKGLSIYHAASLEIQVFAYTKCPEMPYGRLIQS